MREVDKVSIDCQTESCQSLVMVFQELKLCQQILNPWVKVMESMYSVYKLSIRQTIGVNHMEMAKISIGTHNVKISHRDSPIGILLSISYPS